MFAPGRMAFGKPKSEGLPALSVRELNRRETMLKEAVGIVTGGLPQRGEAIHGLITGRFDLMHVLVAILGVVKSKCDHMRIATLSYNRRNLAEMLNCLDAGLVGRLSLICSKFFKENTKELFGETTAEFAKRNAQLAGPRSHCKVVCFHFADDSRLVIEGSANLRTNGNWEQFAIINHDGLHDWHAAWIDDLLSRDEQ